MNPDEKYCYLRQTAIYRKNDYLLRKAVTKNNKTFHILYKKEWADKYSWHTYSPYLNGGLCKVCVLFHNPHAENRGIFVRKAFQNISKPEKIDQHNGLQYHGAATLKAQGFKDVYEKRCHNVNQDPNKGIKFANKQHIL